MNTKTIISAAALVAALAARATGFVETYESSEASATNQWTFAANANGELPELVAATPAAPANGFGVIGDHTQALKVNECTMERNALSLSATHTVDLLAWVEPYTAEQTPESGANTLSAKPFRLKNPRIVVTASAAQKPAKGDKQ